MRPLWPTLLAFACSEPPCGDLGRSDEDKGPGNLLVVVLDDFGIDQLSAYQVGRDLPKTPTIDCLCDRGMRFRNAWATPYCTPTRAALFSGMHANRFGIGRFTNVATDPWELPLGVETLPERLRAAGYASALAGKWHLSGQPSPTSYDHPQRQGFDHWRGSLGNLEHSSLTTADLDYDSWERVVDGEPDLSTTYATVQTTDDALHFARTLPEPWLLVVSYNAPHHPWHVPPADLTAHEPAEGAPAHRLYRAMVESVDHELGRLLQQLDDRTLASTTVVLLGDNGTPPEGVRPPVASDQHKGNTSEGALRVPLILAGPAVAAPGTETAALASVVDLLATLAEIAGVSPPEGIDGISLLPVLEDPAGSVRERMFSHLDDEGVIRFMARDARFKVVRTEGEAPTYFEVDPHDLVELPLDPDTLGTADSQRLTELAAYLEAQIAATDNALDPG